MTIGILGASSQVGSSLALYFKHHYNAKVVCFNRSAYSNIFFETFDISYRSADLHDISKLQEAFNDIDVMVDCTYPGGQLFEIPTQIRSQVPAVVSALKPGSAFIYMSSIMAYGMGSGEKYVKHSAISKSSYAYIKRIAEQVTLDACKKHSIKAFVFRLGQVHGFLQSVNAVYRKKLSTEAVTYVDGEPEEKTNTIFISSLAEAILQCASGNVNEGLYTLVSDPQWSLQQLYDYYCEHYNIAANVKFVASNAHKKKSPGLKQMMFALAKKQRNLLETYILINRPKTAIKLKGLYRVSEARSALNNHFEYSDFNLLGTPSHAPVKNMECSVSAIHKIETLMEDFYIKTINEHRREF